MELTEWLIQTNQILHNAEQNLPAESINQLRIFQQTLMINHLQSGFLSGSIRSPLERAMDANPFRNIDFSQPVEATKEPNEPLKSHWSERTFREATEPSTPKDWDAKPIAPPPKDWSVLER